MSRLTKIKIVIYTEENKGKKGLTEAVYEPVSKIKGRDLSKLSKEILTNGLVTIFSSNRQGNSRKKVEDVLETTYENPSWYLLDKGVNDEIRIENIKKFLLLSQ